MGRMVRCGTMRAPFHTQETGGTDASSSSSGIGSPDCAGKEKGSRRGSLCWYVGGTRARRRAALSDAEPCC